jgi:nitroimidazol reductase NimA-like FMN-containing flavoprotein (pyridoxamine 5'-phosphate oxidase superfamily)
MLINELPQEECKAVLERAPVVRLACALDNQPYVVPVHFAYDGQYIYVFSTVGKKIEWMRANPKVCIQTDIETESEWVSVIINGRYEELTEQYPAERKHANTLLAKRYQWWLNALAQRRMTLSDSSIEPLFFRIHIDSMTGLRAAEKDIEIRELLNLLGFPS